MTFPAPILWLFLHTRRGGVMIGSLEVAYGEQLPNFVSRNGLTFVHQRHRRDQDWPTAVYVQGPARSGMAVEVGE